MRCLAARAGAAAGALVAVAALATPGAAAPSVLALPKPTGPIPVIRQVFVDRPDRLNVSVLPGEVDDTERVDVLVDPAGVPAVVTMTQRLVLSGTGAFIVYERSSATNAVPLDDSIEPGLKREAVVWQGFVSGRKVIAATLTLTPEIERQLLPVGVELGWSGPGRIGPGGTLPGAGTLTVRLVNRTHRAVRTQTADVAASHLAGPLDKLLKHAQRHDGTPPPAAGRGLPATLPATGFGARDTDTYAPLRVDGRITIEGVGPVRIDGPTATQLPAGNSAVIGGVLDGDATFTAEVPAAARLVLDIAAVPGLDPRLLLPPNADTWAAWAAQHPSVADRRRAVDTLVDAAYAAARDDEYAPYLGHHAPGPVHTSFHIAMAAPEQVAVAAKPLRPKPFALSLAAVALVAIAANGTAIWRRL